MSEQSWKEGSPPGAKLATPCVYVLFCKTPSLSYLKSRCTLKYELQYGILFRRIFVHLHSLQNMTIEFFPSYIPSEVIRFT